jgi:hypothetical protein
MITMPLIITLLGLVAGADTPTIAATIGSSSMLFILPSRAFCSQFISFDHLCAKSVCLTF